MQVKMILRAASPVKFDGPLDMRMNPQRGQPVSAFLQKVSAENLATLLVENADEPKAAPLSDALAGKNFATTQQLAAAVRAALPDTGKENADLAVRRVFQALRIAVNDEFSALDTFLRHLPGYLKPGGRVAILTFHSGEDRRVKHAFAEGRRNGVYLEIADEVMRPTRRRNGIRIRGRRRRNCGGRGELERSAAVPGRSNFLSSEGHRHIRDPVAIEHCCARGRARSTI